MGDLSNLQSPFHQIHKSKLKNDVEKIKKQKVVKFELMQQRHLQILDQMIDENLQDQKDKQQNEQIQQNLNQPVAHHGIIAQPQKEEIKDPAVLQKIVENLKILESEHKKYLDMYHQNPDEVKEIIKEGIQPDQKDSMSNKQFKSGFVLGQQFFEQEMENIKNLTAQQQKQIGDMIQKSIENQQNFNKQIEYFKQKDLNFKQKVKEMENIVVQYTIDFDKNLENDRLFQEIKQTIHDAFDKQKLVTKEGKIDGRILNGLTIKLRHFAFDEIMKAMQIKQLNDLFIQSSDKNIDKQEFIDGQFKHIDQLEQVIQQKVNQIEAIEQVNKQLDNDLQKYQKFEEKNAQLLAKIKEYEDKLASGEKLPLKTEQFLNKKIHDLEKQITQNNEKIKNQEHQIRDLFEKCKNFDNLKDENDKLVNKIANKSHDYDQLLKNNEHQKSVNKNLQHDHKLKIDDFQEQIKEMEKKLSEKDNLTKNQEEEKKSLTKKMNEFQKQFADERKDHNLTIEKHNKLQDQKQELTKQFKDIKAKYDHLILEITPLQTQIDYLVKRILSLEKQLRDKEDLDKNQQKELDLVLNQLSEIQQQSNLDTSLSIEEQSKLQQKYDRLLAEHEQFLRKVVPFEAQYRQLEIDFAQLVEESSKKIDPELHKTEIKKLSERISRLESEHKNKDDFHTKQLQNLRESLEKDFNAQLKTKNDDIALANKNYGDLKLQFDTIVSEHEKLKQNQNEQNNQLKLAYQLQIQQKVEEIAKNQLEYSSQIQQLRNHIQNQREQFDQEKIKLKTSHKNEIDQSVATLEVVQNELNSLRQNYDKLQQLKSSELDTQKKEIQQLKKKISDQLQTITQHEKQLVSDSEKFNSEINTLKQTLDMEINKNSNLDQQISVLQHNVHQLQTFQNDKQQNHEKEIQNLQGIINTKQNELLLQKDAYDKKITEFSDKLLQEQNKFQQLGYDLNKNISEKNKQIEQLTLSEQEIQKKFKKLHDDYEKLKQINENNNQEAKNSLDRDSKKIKKLEEDVKKHLDELQRHEAFQLSEKNRYEGEIQKLNGEIAQKEQMIKTSIDTSSTFHKNEGEMIQKIEQMKKTIEQLESYNSSMNENNAQQFEEISSLKQQLSQQSGEIQALLDKIKQNENNIVDNEEFEQFNKQYEAIKQEVVELTAEKRKQQNIHLESQDIIKKLQKEKEELLKQIDLQKEQLVIHEQQHMMEQEPEIPQQAEVLPEIRAQDPNQIQNQKQLIEQINGRFVELQHIAQNLTPYYPSRVTSNEGHRAKLKQAIGDPINLRLQNILADITLFHEKNNAHIFQLNYLAKRKNALIEARDAQIERQQKQIEQQREYLQTIKEQKQKIQEQKDEITKLILETHQLKQKISDLEKNQDKK